MATGILICHSLHKSEYFFITGDVYDLSDFYFISTIVVTIRHIDHKEKSTVIE